MLAASPAQSNKKIIIQPLCLLRNPVISIRCAQPSQGSNKTLFVKSRLEIRIEIYFAILGVGYITTHTHYTDNARMASPKSTAKFFFSEPTTKVQVETSEQEWRQ